VLALSPALLLAGCLAALVVLEVSVVSAALAAQLRVVLVAPVALAATASAVVPSTLLVRSRANLLLVAVLLAAPAVVAPLAVVPCVDRGPRA